MQKILSGTLVLDLTRFFSGPQATLFLAGLGAQVVKIDDPATGDPTAFSPPYAGPGGVSFQRTSDADMGLAYLKRARGKQSVMLDLKSEAGREVLLRMVAGADVVIDNFSAGVADRLGIGYDALAAVNPGIVYCSLTGYGATGSDRHLKAYDLMVQAAVGLMSVTGEAGGPPVKTGSPLSDAIAGVFAASGILAALLHRQRTGRGQAVDVSMADCLFSLMFDEPFDCYERLGLPLRQGSRIMRFSPFNVYRSRDGWVVLGAATAADWTALLGAMDRRDLADDTRMNDLGWRIAHNAQVDAIVSAWTEARATLDIVQALHAAKVPCSPVRSIDEVMQWRQLRERGMVVPVHNPMTGTDMAASAPGFPIKFSAGQAGYDAPAPLPGAHTQEILETLAGLSPQRIEELAARGVVRCAPQAAELQHKSG